MLSWNRNWILIILDVSQTDQKSRGGGGNSNLFIRGCAILALNIAPINPAALPKKDTHKSEKKEPHKALTTVSSMSKAGKIILRQFFTHKSGEGLKWHPKIRRKLKMTPINPKSAQKSYPKKWHTPVHQHMEVTLPPGRKLGGWWNYFQEYYLNKGSYK